MNKKIAGIVGVIIISGVSFFGGMKYTASQNPVSTRGVGFQRGIRTGGTGGGFVTGEIISKDDKSVTIKLRDPRQPDGQGGSKIIFLSASTSIMKSILGSLGDITVGEQITATGNTNADGSITAQSIQMRPMIPINR